MEQQEQTRHKQLNIHLKKDGELNLSGLTLENLTTEEFLVVQQLIDESKVRSQSNRQIEELMQRGMMAQTAIAAKRRVADYVNRLPLSERPRWIAEYQLQGLVTLPEPPAQQLPPRPGIPNPDIADIDEGSVQSVINPGAMKILQAIAANYPDYIRIDGAWIDELCDAASNQNMTLRSNHHFYISGGTQSGKSTLAGVIINKIAAKSQSPAIVIGSDPKDEVTRWLCKFSRKFDDYYVSKIALDLKH